MIINADQPPNPSFVYRGFIWIHMIHQKCWSYDVIWCHQHEDIKLVVWPLATYMEKTSGCWLRDMGPINIIWLVVYLPLWRILVSWEYYSQYMERHVPNHQPVMVRIVRIMMITPNIGWQMLMMLVVSTSNSTALLSLWLWKLVGFICFNSRMSSQQQTQEMNGGGHLNS